MLGAVDVFAMYPWLRIAVLVDAPAKTAGQGSRLKCERRVVQLYAG